MRRYSYHVVALVCTIGSVGFGGVVVRGQAARPAAAQTPAPAQKPPTVTSAPGVSVPADYVIGPEDQLQVLFWREKDMSADVVVRPDGKISLPLINELQASGLTPEQLRQKITEEAKRFVEDPNTTIVVKQINSRRVFITGEVGKPGPYPLMSPTTVLQLISVAGGLREYADGKKILIMRTVNGTPTTFSFNYRDVISGKNLKQNIELKPGDTVIVP